MVSQAMPLRLILPAGGSMVAAAIGALLQAGGRCVGVAAGQGDALLVDALDDADAVAALALDDERFEAAFVENTLDRVAALQQGIKRLARPANIVVIASDAYLGRWNGVAQAAASAAMVGIVRSLAMEHERAEMRFNMLALPLGAQADDAVLMRDAAAQAFDLLTTRSITGETILLDGGNNLKFRQARRR